jgi:MinD-like ATPase involved in chromosome partitioning or flagellar assembly
MLTQSLLEANAHVVLVGSGKGGVGKSLLSILLAAEAASAGRRVLLFDADMNLGTLHVLLGLRPAARVDALLDSELEPADLVCRVSRNLWLLPGTCGAERLHDMPALDRARLELRLSAVFANYDLVIADAGSGLDGAIRTATISADRLVVVATPEPAALTGAYALMKVAHLRTPKIPIDVLVNRCQNDVEGAVAFDKLAFACDRFLSREIHHLGTIAEDASLALAARDPEQCLTMIRRAS